MINVEIKARCGKEQRQRIFSLLGRRGIFGNTDRQTDTYFVVPNGRLKLREGNIENALIHYEREDRAGPKVSKYILTPVEPGSTLKESLTKALGVLQVVEKVRNIFFVDNVKIHLDEVTGLGYFVEIEARDEKEEIGNETLYRQCRDYMKEFGIVEEDLVTQSYSDLLGRVVE